MPRLRRRLLVGGAVLLGAGTAVTAAASSSALAAADDLRAAQARLSAVRDGAPDPSVAETELRAAAELVASADDQLGEWPVDVLASVPVLGRSFDAERAVTDTSAEVIAGALVLADGLRDVRASAGGLDLAVLDRAHDDVAGPARRARAALDRLRSTSTALTPPQVTDGVEQASQGLGPAVVTLERAEAGLGVAGGLFGASGPRTVMLALQNNAELRGAGGYVSTFGTGRLQGGRLALDPLLDVTSVADPPDTATRVPAPPEYAEDYGPLSGDTTIFRSWNMSPHVPDAALVGSRVVDALLGTAPDVVVLLDVPAMGALAALGGDAVVLPDGSRVSPEELTQALLVDAYADAGTDLDQQNLRRARLQAAATVTVERLLAGDLPAADVLRTLTRLAQGRHLSVWSAREDEQETLDELGLAGAIEAPGGGDLVHVSLNNIGGNKLDIYADRRLAVDVRLRRGQAEVVQRLSLTNRAPQGLVPYVAGVDVPGSLVNRVEFSLPIRATQISIGVDGAVRPEQPSIGEARQRLAVRTQTPRGATSVVELRYVLPLRGGSYRLRLVPQPLVSDADLSLSVQPVEGVGTTPDAVDEVDEPFARTRDLTVRLPR